jgi:hypothetical protein
MSEVKNFFNDFLENLETTSKDSCSFKRPIVSPKDFANNWLKIDLFPEQEKIVNAVFSSDFKEFNRAYNEYVICHGKGSGKDLIIAFILVYTIYWLEEHENPHAYLGILDGESIDIVNMAFDADQANSVFFQKFKNFIINCKNPATNKNYFEEQGMNIEKAIFKDRIEFPKHINAWCLNSKEGKAEGKNILLAIFDEVGSFRFDKADSLRDHVKSSAKTRFKDLFKIFYISFIWEKNDYMCHLIDTAEEGGIAKCYHTRKATWEVRTSNVDNPTLKKFSISKDDLQDDYDEDAEKAMLKYECKVPKSSKTQFIRKAELILSSCNKTNYPNNGNVYRPSPIIGDPLYTNDILHEELEAWFRPRMTYELSMMYKEFAINPTVELETKIRLEEEKLSSAEYFAHFDLSRGVVDCAGLLIGHTYNVLNSKRFYVDLAIQVRAAKDSETTQEIDQTSILTFVTDILLDKLKFPIKHITADGFQSALFFDFCRKKGIECTELSLVKTTVPYETMMDLLYREELDLYYYPVMVRELTELQYKDGKIDHPNKSNWRAKEEGLPRGSKDISDCLAGAVYTGLQESCESSTFFGKSDKGNSFSNKQLNKLQRYEIYKKLRSR